MTVRHRKGLCGVKWFVIYTCVIQYCHSTVQLVTVHQYTVGLVTAVLNLLQQYIYVAGHNSIALVTAVLNLQSQ